MASEPNSKSGFFYFDGTNPSDFYFGALPLKPDQIRVLQLFPASSLENQVECRVRRISLANNQSSGPINTGAARSITYEALSYTWGKSTANFSIRL